MRTNSLIAGPISREKMGLHTIFSSIWLFLQHNVLLTTHFVYILIDDQLNRRGYFKSAHFSSFKGDYHDPCEKMFLKLHLLWLWEEQNIK